ncbi:unnamed protein product [Paramecium octaurelia]|uniref:Uncharacterized protein n=1 Tax=Paramecium octaurelia TaxID=43137 RepID=A0A8S1XZN7_PAROT|nr:unnamed protein product [Paramecium octaurelia]
MLNSDGQAKSGEQNIKLIQYLENDRAISKGEETLCYPFKEIFFEILIGVNLPSLHMLAQYRIQCC